MNIALDQELDFHSFLLKYKKCLELAYESTIAGAVSPTGEAARAELLTTTIAEDILLDNLNR